MHIRRLLCCLLLVLASVPLAAQQTGQIAGTVTSDGQPLPGVTVEARSNVLPQPRVTTTDANGRYSLPALVPGSYTLTFTLSGLQTATRRANVQLAQTTTADVSMGMAGVSEQITVTAQASLVERTSTQVETGLTQSEIQALPVQQNYGDLQKLIPGVMYSQDAVRGPSAGASGQDNVYMFDGVNITLPLFGVLNVEPNTRDIAQVSVVKGGAKAIDFNRAGGFLIDSVSKSGTNEFVGEIGLQARPASFVSDQVGTQNVQYDQDRTWATLNLGGPVLRDRLYFYGSYYRPEYQQSSQSNLYGEIPDYVSETNEFFGKFTYTPTQSLLINASYRDSHSTQTPSSFGAFQAPTSGTAWDTRLKLGTFETSWIISPRSYASGKYTDYRSPGGGTSANVADARVSTTLGTQLDIGNLGQLGRFIVPSILPNNAAQNAFVRPFIDQYGYVCPDDAASRGLSCTPGQRTGGGTVGFGEFIEDNDDFFRRGAQLAYNLNLGTRVSHDLHFGFQQYKDSEDRYQTSNGWGILSAPAGVGVAGTCPASACGSATPAFFVATFSQQSTGSVPTIHSEFVSRNIEINDTIRWNNWAFNVGLLASSDTLYGQGLAKADNIAGFVKSQGTKYKMKEFGFGDMLQPRLGATWAYNGNDTVWGSYARYYPAANSNARAASWDRGLVAQINAYFDQSGKLIGVQPNAASAGKWWQEGIKPPHIDEFMVGTARQLTPRWTARLYGRAREGKDYTEDTNNNARIAFEPPSDIPRELYVPNLNEIIAAIGSGGSYVVANLDGAFTRYYEATLEQEWRADKLILNGSYTWSHYYGNFDQDNTTFNSANDTSTFIGSSNIGDGAGRQLWDFKYGDLRGDRRNVVKLRGTYILPWRATVGAFGVFQSGQPYQLESVLPYRPLTGSTSETNRYAEPAGSRRSPSMYNADVNYTQNFPLVRGINMQLAVDVFNVTDNQVGYNYETRVGVLGLKQIANTASPYQGETVPIPESIGDAALRTQLGIPASASFNRADYAVAAPFAKSFFAPRRYQVSVRFQF